MKFLILKSNCAVVTGENGSFMYDLSHKNYYSLDLLHTEILNNIKKGKCIEELNNLFDQNIVNSFTNKLIEGNLAELSDYFYIEEISRVGHARPVNNIQLNTCYIELPSSCAMSCKSCKSLKLFSCLTCSSPTVTSAELDMKFYRGLLSDVLKMSVQTLIFHGGDPLTYGDKFLELLQYARENADENVRIIVKTNGEILNDKMMSHFIEFKINPLFVLRYSKENEYQNNLPLKLSEIFQGFFNHKLQYSCNIVLDSPAQLEAAIQKLSDYNFSDISTSILINEHNSLRSYASIQFSEKLFHNFMLNKDLHPCLMGVIAITADRKVIPCPTMVNHPLLDLEQSHLLELFEDPEIINQFWRFSLGKIEKCKACKIKYSCVDCRSVEEALSKDLYKKEICYLGN
ncbi:MULTISPECIES: 4Fe-4S cluster-binding domain-containing protein [unclassified Paenibacillus]|uniref:4Fe-4S cluster-binding domain-containing protein n=1 Tax=unclassified Paenibacillus TaxID=185978 RepID=UPI00240610F4|nr:MULTISPECIES: 4Fe-4S cluster-binding domain-containing protein [unclassified Paenibacillus]MDF9842711.1 radical SAM protein with 4Fe4S-binding SPASM domain [Paenibacillus sp. PastF-2]MDF9849421.1 radical SAM protein with 4Fe4S-binding SPASM domain [Paenibacillus sp. PastM-2]MDF9855871.1 radical SAM protein with 4Fe4S-binding SPASM domain [Paenibacillus sp. PastF-1]MDH6481263.1 radical SAM protein with 4Fe4S-binding SPASM domain [Paenibacillus sp. PastH-2]MDH6508682.1 radical SAM protein wit